MKSIATCLAVLMTLCVALLPRPAHADAFDTMRTKWTNYLTCSADINMSDPVIASRVAGIASLAQTEWTSMDKSVGRTYLWSDIASTTDTAQINQNYTRLWWMARAVRTPGSTLLNNATLTTDIINALDWLNANRYKNDGTHNGNWWDLEIGIPQDYLNVITLLYDSLTSTQRDTYTKTILSKAHTSLDYTGANGTWQTKVWALTGMLRKNIAANGSAHDFLNDAKLRINNVLLVQKAIADEAGFCSDYSYISHNNHPYQGGYGTSFFEDILNLHVLLDGSTWAPNDISSFLTNIYAAYEPSIYKMYFFESVLGRYVADAPGLSAGMSVTDSVLRAALIAPLAADQSRLQSMAKEWYLAVPSSTQTSFLNGLTISEYVMATTVFNDSGVTRRGDLNACSIFPATCRFMAARPGWAASIAMYNKDTVSGTRPQIFSNETLSAETPYGAHLSDGSLQLLNDDFFQYSTNTYANMDWDKIPGTTVAYGVTIPQWGEDYANGSNFAGGASVNGWAVAGFELAPVTTSVFGYLHAWKSWFCFDQEIVCLGSDIRATNGAETHKFYTIVDNRKIDAAGDNAFVVNGVTEPTTLGWALSTSGVNWVSLAGNATGTDIGYVFPGSSSLSMQRITRGSSNFLEMWVNHGTAPSAASYAYILLPNYTSAQTQSYASSIPILVLENSADAQAVWKASIGITGALFLKDAAKTVMLPPANTSSVISSNKRAAVLVDKVTGFVRVNIADPTWENTGTITVEIWPSAAGNVTGLVSKDSQVTVVQMTPTLKLTVNVNGAKGKSLTAKFTTSP